MGKVFDGRHVIGAAVAVILASPALADTARIRTTSAISGITTQQAVENEETVTKLPSIDTSNRATCRRQVETKTYASGFRCIWQSTGEIDPGCRLNLMLSEGDEDGGHGHAANRPLGTLNRNTSLGTLDFIYTVPEVAGTVDLVASGVDSNGNNIAPYTIHIEIGRTDLQQLPASTEYRFVGTDANHSSRYWGTAELNDALIALARAYHEVYPTHTLGYNDMNLESGGLYDIRANWSEPHCGHRGDSADLRTNDIPMARLADVQLMIARAGLGLHDETDTDTPHFHLSR